MNLETSLCDRLSTRELDELGKRLHADGKFGKDYSPMSKAAKAEFIVSEAKRLYPSGEDAETMVMALTKGIEDNRDEPGSDDPDDYHGGKDVASTASKGVATDGPSPTESLETKAFAYDPPSEPADGKCHAPEGHDDPGDCQYHEGGLCPSMEGGECEQCGVQFRNADSHNGDCPVEAQLHDMHSPSDGQGQGNGNGSASCAPLCECIDPLLLQQIITMVAHGEFDPVFKDIEKAFEMVSNEIIASAKSATKGKQDILDALKAVKEMKRKRASTAEKLVIEFPHAPPVAMTTQHPIIFPQVMALMCLPDNIRQPVLLFGEAGAGKSTLWEQVAMALDLFENDYSAMSMAGDTTSGKINGRILPVGEGIYVPSELVRRLLLERPFLFVFDEYDAPSPEIQVGMHTFLANDAIYVEERSFAKEPVRIPKPRGTRVGAACNTNLAGGTGRYQGRQAQDGATRDRWLCLKVMENPAIAAGICGVSYDPLPTWLPQPYTEAELRELLATAHKWYIDTQKAVAAKKVPQLVTPRALLRARACLMAGFTWLETRKVLLAGWKQDELDQIGETEIRAY